MRRPKTKKARPGGSQVEPKMTILGVVLDLSATMLAEPEDRSSLLSMEVDQ